MRDPESVCFSETMTIMYQLTRHKMEEELICHASNDSMALSEHFGVDLNN